MEEQKEPQRKRVERAAPAEGTQKVAVRIEPEMRKRKKRSAVVKPSKNAKKFASNPIFIDQGLVLQEEMFLFCEPCGKRVSCDKLWLVNQHCFGQGGDADKWSQLSDADKKKIQHNKNRLSLQKRDQEKLFLQKAVEQHREDMFQKLEKKATVVGATLPSGMVADRTQVLLTLWKNGIPLAKLDDPDFVDLVEQSHAALGGREGVRRNIPVANKFLQDRVIAAVDGRYVSIFFDGSKVNEAIEAVIVRVLTDDFNIRHLCIGALMVNKNLTSTTLLEAVKTHLAAADISPAKIVCATSDSASVNVAMVGDWNASMSTFFGQERDECVLTWIGCLSHGLSNAGTAMRKAATSLKFFFGAYKKMSNTSMAARRVWEELMKVRCPVLCDNRWWCWYDCTEQMFQHWAQVPTFLRTLQRRQLAEKSTQKMMTLLNDSKSWLELELQIRAALVFGKPLRDACILLEGDGFLLPYVASTLRNIRTLMDDLSVYKEKHLLFEDLRKRCREEGMYEAGVDQAISKIVPIVIAGYQKFRESVWAKAATLFPLYEAASLFHPIIFLERCQTKTFADSFLKDSDQLSNIKGVPRLSKDFRLALLQESTNYKNLAVQFRKDVEANPPSHTPLALWEWWVSQRLNLPKFFEIASLLVLIQPSSAIVERFYSILKGETSEQQNAEYADTFAGRAKALFNERK